MSLAMLKRPTIRIRYDDAIRPNTNRLFGPLFGTEANTNRIFGTSLLCNVVLKHYCACTTLILSYDDDDDDDTETNYWSRTYCEITELKHVRMNNSY